MSKGFTQNFVVAALIAVVLSVFSVQLSAQQASTSTVWFYRPLTDDSDLVSTVYLTNGAGSRRLATLGKGEFFGLALNPGLYSFSWNRAPARGEQTIIAVSPDQQGFVEVLARSIKSVPLSVAFQKMNGISPVQEQNVFDAAVIAPTEILLPVIGSTAPVSAAPTPQGRAVALAAAPVTRAVTPQERIDTGEALNAPRRFEIFYGPSYSRQGSVNLIGGDLALAIKLSDSVSLVADVSNHIQNKSAGIFDVAAATDARLWTYRFGPKISARPNRRITTFSHVLVGGARFTETDAILIGRQFVATYVQVNGFSGAVGGGLDIAIKPWFALRAFQAEYSALYFRDLGWSQGARLGAGLMFRIR